MECHRGNGQTPRSRRQPPGTSCGSSPLHSVQVQRYAADGTPTGAQVQANTYTTSLQFDPSVGMDASGDFIVVWNSFGSFGTDSDGPSALGQRFAADGSTVSAEVQVNTYTTGFQDSPSIAVDADGDFVVVWTSSGVRAPSALIRPATASRGRHRTSFRSSCCLSRSSRSLRSGAAPEPSERPSGGVVRRLCRCRAGGGTRNGLASGDSPSRLLLHTSIIGSRSRSFHIV